MLKSYWKDPVWSAVIATVIVAAVGAVGTVFLNLWPAIGQFVTSVTKAAGEPSNMPNWLFWLISVIATPTVLFLAIALWQAIRPTAEAIDCRSYISDGFLNLRWRWSYYYDGGLGDIHSFCPHCDFQVFPVNASAYSAVDRIEFHCDSCQRSLATFEEPYASVESKVRRFIQQKIRNGEWLNKSCS